MIPWHIKVFGHKIFYGVVGPSIPLVSIAALGQAPIGIGAGHSPSSSELLTFLLRPCSVALSHVLPLLSSKPNHAPPEPTVLSWPSSSSLDEGCSGVCPVPGNLESQNRASPKKG